jgi:hypothetical protein
MTYKEQLKEALAEKKWEFELLLVEYINCTTMTYDQIAERFGISRQQVAAVATYHKVNRKRGMGSPASTRWKQSAAKA